MSSNLIAPTIFQSVFNAFAIFSSKGRRPARRGTSSVGNCNLPNRTTVWPACVTRPYEVGPHRPYRLHGQPRRWHVGPKHDAADRQQENDTETNERDVFHPAESLNFIRRSAVKQL